MAEEVDIKFERESRDGVVAVGTYLIDAAGRLGIEIDDGCGRIGACDDCAVTVKTGRDLLSEVTKAETEQLSAERLANGERLSCQAKVVKAGEVVIMTKEKKQEEKESEEAKKEEYRKEFEELPLEKKIANLLELEMITLGETISFVFNSPFKIFEKAMDVMAEFGLKLEKEAKEARTPEEHQENGNKDSGETGKKGEKKEKTKKQPKAKKSE